MPPKRSVIGRSTNQAKRRREERASETRIGGEPKSVKRLRSGDLLIETLSAVQTKSFLQAKIFLNSPVNIYPHKTLNSCRGIISEPDLLTTTDAEILDGFSGQGVIQPVTLTAEFARTFRIFCAVSSAREPKCINCSQPHPSNSKICPKWKIEKQIQEIKTKNISYPEARKLIVPRLSQTYAQAAKSSTLNNSTQTHENITKIKCPPLKLLAPLSSEQRPNIPTAVTTSSSSQAQLLPSISSKTSTMSALQPPTPMSNAKENIKEQSSQAHCPQKISETDTDADPSDTDYVTGLASEEDESLLEASHTDDVKDIIRQYHPVCVALQETYLKSCDTTKIRRYGCVRKDTEGSSVSGGVCIFTFLDVPSSALLLHTSLQAVAVRIHSTSLITVCCLYFLPNAVIHQQDLNNLVDQLPEPFVILGDFNGHSTLWGSVKTNPRGRQIEQLAVIPDAMGKTESVDTAVQEVTNVLITAEDLSIPKVSSHSFQRYKPWWNTDCQTAYKNQRKL
ncbi:putative RNA-directed DNA polymerase from transposon X-element [Trichonephila clavipes]|nr:putative RNA-directed DNA polymerase from transposon X-element [Trichonephila clavipes]